MQEASDGGTSGIFVESPSSYSSPSLNQTDSSEDCEDYLQVSVLKATLLEDQDQQVCCSSTAAVPFHPYVILEMDHPAQRYNTMPTEHVKNGPKNSREFTWPNGHLFKLWVVFSEDNEVLSLLVDPPLKFVLIENDWKVKWKSELDIYRVESWAVWVVLEKAALIIRQPEYQLDT